MNTTNVGTAELKKYSNVATPHYVYPDGKTVTVAYTSSDTLGSAGAVNSNVIEMARWVTMLLNGGMFNNKRVLSGDRIWDLWTPHTVIPLSRSAKKRFPTTHFRDYGLGWVLIDYHGHKVVYHGGGLDGMISRVAMVPDLKLGLVVLTNSINSLPSALAYKIIDTYLDVSPTDWSRIYLDQYLEEVEKEKQSRAADTKEKKQESGKKCPGPNPGDYTGLYGGPMYGDARVTLDKGTLVLDFLPTPVFISDLTHMHYDTFRLTLRKFFSFIPAGTGTVQFIRDRDGNVKEMKVDIPNRDFLFTELEFKKKE